MLQPPRIWWKPLNRLEKSWLTIALVWCIFMTIMMPLWYYFGKQNVPTVTYRVEPAAFVAMTETFAAQYKIGETPTGMPIVAPPPDSDIYLLAQRWSWYPVLQLEKGQTYRLHLSSRDLQHGFSLQPVNLNLQVLPGYDYVATITPTTSGEFTIVCNEFCQIGHHTMVGKMIVTDN